MIIDAHGHISIAPEVLAYKAQIMASLLNPDRLLTIYAGQPLYSYAVRLMQTQLISGRIRPTGDAINTLAFMQSLAQAFNGQALALRGNSEVLAVDYIQSIDQSKLAAQARLPQYTPKPLGGELAPLAGFYPSVYVGVPWWFLDAPEAMRRFRSAVMETAGFSRTSGFVDDTRAFCSIPARHDTARRIDAGVLAKLVAEHQLEEDEALETAVDLVTKQPTTVFKL